MIVPQHYFDKLPTPLDGEKVLLKEHPLQDQITTTYAGPRCRHCFPAYCAHLLPLPCLSSL